MTHDYPPIDSYAFLSDTHTAALLAPDGAVEWFCVPAFDGGSVFARILDRRRGGDLRLDVADAGLPQRRYLDESLVLQSRYRAGDATVTVHDFLAVADGADRAGDPLVAQHLLVRLVEVDGGAATVRIRVDARPDYARAEPDWRRGDDGCWRHENPALWLACQPPLEQVGTTLRGEVELADGQAFALVLGYGPAEPRPVDPDAARRLLEHTRDAWRRWSARGQYAGLGRDRVRHSALVLRGLAFDESGALLAAPTTSLPEEIGGVRNWDYRYTWHRDAALLLLALFRLGHDEEGTRYMRFLLHACADKPGRLLPMAGIRGEHEGDETELEHLEGYAGSRPVRVGNEAFEQTQLDTYGHVLDAALAYQEITGSVRPDEWTTLRRYVDSVAEHWHEPDHGIWEVRGPCRHYVNSKVMAWVCLDRGVRLAGLLGDDDAPVDRWRRAADELRAEVLERGYDHDLDAFVMAYDLPALDASLLRMPLVGFLPGDDPRMVATIDRIIERLTEDGLVHRYDRNEVDDGLPGLEGAFLLCSFELVSALVLAGRVAEAEEAYHRLCRRAGPLGLFSEEMAKDGTALGNYPQAFTHLALIEAAINLDSSGSTEALHHWAAGRSVNR